MNSENSTPEESPRATQLISAWAAGAVCSGALQIVFYPGLPFIKLLGAKLLVVWPGNLLLGAILSLAWLLAGRLHLTPVRFRASEPWMFWMGCSIGLSAFLGAWVRELYEHLLVVPACLLVLLAIGVMGLRVPPPGRALRVGIVSVGVLAIPLCAFVLPQNAPDMRGGGDTAASLQPLDSEAPQGLPNFVLISVDTLRADAVLDETVPTPHLDALRGSSMWAPYGHAPAPATMPSHATMMTGVGVLEHGARKNTKKVPDAIPTLAEMLSERGYRTIGVSSTAVLSRATAFHRGFQTYQNLAYFNLNFNHAKNIKWVASKGTWLGLLSPGKYEERLILALVGTRLEEGDGSARGRLTRKVSVEYLQQLAGDPRPFFLFLHFMDPHQPYAADDTVAGSLAGDLQLPSEYHGLDPGGLITARIVQSDLNLNRDYAEDAVPVLHRLYLEELVFMDACVGAILEELETISSPTYVLFTSDHGEHFGEHGLMLHNNSVYEELLRVPFMLRGPGVTPGRMTDTPLLLDIAPTFLSRTDIPVPPNMPGRDLLDESRSPISYAGASLDEIAWYEGPWKLVASYESLGREDSDLKPVALYHTVRDPRENHNLLRSEPERAQLMLAAAQQRARKAAIGQDAALSLQQHGTLEELGYGGEDDEH